MNSSFNSNDSFLDRSKRYAKEYSLRKPQPFSFEFHEVSKRPIAGAIRKYIIALIKKSMDRVN